jgi:hypothetical protein
MKSKFTFILLFFTLITFAQPKKNIVKSNFLSLLITVPQVSYERSIGHSQSILISAYSGSFTFIGSEEKIKGANLLHRFYLNENNHLKGFYTEQGLLVRSNYDYGDNKFKSYPGLRGGAGFQINAKSWIIDLGLALAFTREKQKRYDENGNITKSIFVIEPEYRVNASIGYNF